jgi:hypothetical protein
MSDWELFMGGAAVALIVVYVTNVFMRPLKGAPPYLLDLEQYEADLLEARDCGREGKPPPVMMGLMGGEWEEGAEDKMRRNYRVAREIYSRVYSKR